MKSKAKKILLLILKRMCGLQLGPVHQHHYQLSLRTGNADKAFQAGTPRESE